MAFWKMQLYVGNTDVMANINENTDVSKIKCFVPLKNNVRFYQPRTKNLCYSFVKCKIT